MCSPIVWQLIGDIDRTLQSEPIVTCSVPVVMVLSTNVPSAFAVQVPVTVSDPVTSAAGQVKPKLLRRFSWPETVKQDDITVQVPVTVPPHALTFVQVCPEPPLPLLPPLLLAPPPLPVLPPEPVFPPVELPPEPVEPPLLEPPSG